MKVYAVFVHCTIGGYNSRWIDSQWAVRAKAKGRELELDRVMQAFKVAGHETSTVELEIVDAAITGGESASGEHADPQAAQDGPEEKA